MNKNDKDVGRVMGQLEIVLAKLDSMDEKIESSLSRVQALENFKAYFLGITIAVVAITEVFILIFLGR